jgi:hypothetical protein
MKMKILGNVKGEVLAAFEETPGAPVSIAVEPGVGEEVEEFELADSFRSEREALDLYSVKLPLKVAKRRQKSED